MKEKVKRLTQVMIYPEKKVNNARITTISLNNKTIKTPCYIPKIRTSKELDIITDEKKINDYFQGIFFDILNVSSLNREKTIINPKQTRLIPMIKLDFKTLKSIRPVFIDPNTEYLYLNNEQKENNIEISRHFLKRFLISWLNQHMLIMAKYGNNCIMLEIPLQSSIGMCENRINTNLMRLSHSFHLLKVKTRL